MLSKLFLLVLKAQRELTIAWETAQATLVLSQTPDGICECGYAYDDHVEHEHEDEDEVTEIEIPDLPEGFAWAWYVKNDDTGEWELVEGPYDDPNA
jgi:hypothetical protein